MAQHHRFATYCVLWCSTIDSNATPSSEISSHYFEKSYNNRSSEAILNEQNHTYGFSPTVFPRSRNRKGGSEADSLVPFPGVYHFQRRSDEAHCREVPQCCYDPRFEKV